MEKNALSPLYVNDVTSEYLSDQDRTHLSEETVATFSSEVLAQARTSEVYRRTQPATGIFQVAAEGSRLSNGDEIINTLQGCFLLLQRKAVAWPDDVLPTWRIEA